MVAMKRLCMAGLAYSGQGPHRLTHSMRDGRCGGITAQLGGPPENDWDHQMAPPSELAQHIPPWAADIMLNEAQNKEYSQAQRGIVAATYAPVEGREWVGEESHGMAAFTPREIAEDFNTPTESVLAKMLQAGVPERDVKPDRPLSETCSAAQVTELVQFMQSCDPIELRDALSDEPLAALATEIGVETEVLLELAKMMKIKALLGGETLLTHNEYAALRRECLRGAR